MGEASDVPREYAGSVPGNAIGTNLMAVRGVLRLMARRAREACVPVPDPWLVVAGLVAELERHVGPRCTSETDEVDPTSSLRRCVRPEHAATDPGHTNGLWSW